MKCEIVGYKEIGIRSLEPHPMAEAFPRGGDDQASVNTSVEDAGILAPLHVLAEPNANGKWQVVDGCTRLLAADVTERGAGSDQKLPCLLVRVDDVATYVLHINGARRRVSTGTRVLAYITCHKEKVLASAEMAGGRVENMRGSRNGLEERTQKASRDAFGKGDGPQNWSCDAISERLGVSDRDVESAVELLRCREHKLMPSVKIGGIERAERPLDLKNSEEDKMVQHALNGQYLAVLGGQSPVRRWKAALSGHASTANLQKEAINYHKLGCRALVSLRTVFTHWENLTSDEKGEIFNDWHDLLEKLPKQLKRP